MFQIHVHSAPSTTCFIIRRWMQQVGQFSSCAYAFTVSDRSWLILSNIIFVDQLTSPMPFQAADQRLPTLPMVRSETNQQHWWNRPCSADWCLLSSDIKK